MNFKNSYLVLIMIALVLIPAIIGYMVLYSENQNTLTIAGSTSVAPVAEALANAYMQDHPGVRIIVSGGDSNLGINSVRSGSINIGTSSKNLTSSESQGLTQYNIGTDALAIIANNQNPVNSLTVNQLTGIYTGNINNWKQLGGNNMTITPVTREAGSGTRANFESMILGSKSYSDKVIATSSTYDELQTVVTSPNAVGYVARNAVQNQVKLLAVNGVLPDQKNVQAGSYPLKRSMIFLVKGTPTGLTKDFIDFCLSKEGQAIINNVEYNNTASNSNAHNLGIGPSGAG